MSVAAKMALVDLVGLAAVAQLIVFGFLVGRARGVHGVPAPATTGHPVFERYHRVHMNTVESLIPFLPALWLAAKYGSPGIAAVAGGVYLVGRVIYLIGYVRDPAKRGFGYMLTFFPVVVLIGTAAIGALRTLASG